MPLKPGQTLVHVLPNPWHSVDHFGRPAGHCALPRLVSTVGHQGYVGCEIVASAPEKLPEGHQGSAYQDTCWHYSNTPQAYVDGPEVHYYFKRALASGEILPANESTAKYGGVDFRPFAQALAEEKTAAAKRFKAATGQELPHTDPFCRPKPDDKISPLDAARDEGMKAFVASNPELAHQLSKAAAEHGNALAAALKPPTKDATKPELPAALANAGATKEAK